LQARGHVRQRAQAAVFQPVGTAYLISLFEQGERAGEVALLETVTGDVVRRLAVKIGLAQCPCPTERWAREVQRSRWRAVSEKNSSHIEQAFDLQWPLLVSGEVANQPAIVLGRID
jgi:hypothetical protein